MQFATKEATRRAVVAARYANVAAAVSTLALGPMSALPHDEDEEVRRLSASTAQEPRLVLAL